MLFAKGKLHTITYLVFQCVKTGLWLILVIIVIVGYVTIADAASSTSSYVETAGIGFILTVIILYVKIAADPQHFRASASVIYAPKGVAHNAYNLTVSFSLEP